MIGRLIGAGVGAALSKQTRRIGGPAGAVLGALAIPVVSRLRLSTLLAIAGGGFLAKKLADRGDSESGN